MPKAYTEPQRLAAVAAHLDRGMTQAAVIDAAGEGNLPDATTGEHLPAFGLKAGTLANWVMQARRRRKAAPHDKERRIARGLERAVRLATEELEAAERLPVMERNIGRVKQAVATLQAAEQLRRTIEKEEGSEAADPPRSGDTPEPEPQGELAQLILKENGETNS